MSQNKPGDESKPPIVITRPQSRSKEDLAKLAVEMFRSLTGRQPTAEELKELEQEVQEAS